MRKTLMVLGMIVVGTALVAAGCGGGDDDAPNGIRDLTPPEGDEDQITAIVDAADQGIDEIEADPAALTQGDENPLAEASRLASEYGMKACGQG